MTEQMSDNQSPCPTCQNKQPKCFQHKPCPPCQWGTKGGSSIYNDQLPESKAACWAYRISLIPILGLPLYMLFAFIALLRISRKGMTGLRLLRLGLFRSIRMTIVGVLAVAAWWFCPKYSHDTEESYFQIRAMLHRLIINVRKNSCGLIRAGRDPNDFIPLCENKCKVESKINGYGFMMRDFDGELKKIGEWSYYWRTSGLLAMKGHYKNGELDGVWKVWHDEKQLLCENEFQNGKQVHAIEWHYNGNKKSEAFGDDSSVFDQDNGRKISWNEDGTKDCEEFFENAKTIKKIEYDKGRLNYVIEYKNEVEQNEKYFHENGKLKSQGEYKNDKRHGEWKFWDENGVFFKKEIWKNGKLIKTIDTQK